MSNTLKFSMLVSFFSLFSSPVKSLTEPKEKEDVIELINESDIVYKKIAMKIAILETGKFKHHTYKSRKNAFGFKRNSRKLYVSIDRGGYCIYSNVKSSIMDYSLWERNIIKKHKIHNREQFLKYIANRYSKSSKYVQKLNKINISKS